VRRQSVMSIGMIIDRHDTEGRRWQKRQDEEESGTRRGKRARGAQCEREACGAQRREARGAERARQARRAVSCRVEAER